MNARGTSARASQIGSAFVTGASSGIGLELTRLLAGRGTRLGLLALPGDDLDDAGNTARSAGSPQVRTYGCDVRDRDAVRESVHDFAQAVDGLDLFVGCAGVDFENSLDDFQGEKTEFIYDVNLKGLMFGANAALETMLAKRTGHIVGIASLAGWRVLSVHADYSASKAAVIAFLESLRVRLRGTPISVTTVSPGFVRTPMVVGNENPMPFAVEADDAARRILRGIDKRQDRVAFSLPLSIAMRVAKALPVPAWNFLLQAVAKAEKDPHQNL